MSRRLTRLLPPVEQLLTRKPMSSPGAHTHSSAITISAPIHALSIVLSSPRVPSPGASNDFNAANRPPDSGALSVNSNHTCETPTAGPEIRPPSGRRALETAYNEAAVIYFSTVRLSSSRIPCICDISLGLDQKSDFGIIGQMLRPLRPSS